ncbi:MAG: lipopolysaccharide kinase InaA family protein [Syntrophobacteraceae bacterium]
MNSKTHTTIREISQPPFQGMVVADSIVDRFLQSGRTIEDLISQSALPIIESRSTRTAILTVDLESTPIDSNLLFFKEYRMKNLAHSLKPKFCDHRAVNVWNLSWRLLARNIPVPEPYGYLLKERGPFCLAGYSFFEFIPASRHLAAMAKMVAKGRTTLDFGALIESIATQVASMHEGGVVHGDLKWNNILIHESGTKFWFVDLDSARLYEKPPSSKAAAVDIARFIFGGMQARVDKSIGDRFIDKYLKERKLDRRELDAPVEKLLRKHIKRHRFQHNDQHRDL